MMRHGDARHTYLLLGGILGAIVLVFAEMKTFLAAQRYIDDMAKMTPVTASPYRPTAARPLSRSRATGAVSNEPARRLATLPARRGQ